ncbi:hypothetical protein OUZ56_031956 [Daphnia magna]|uniref:Uncharacterized protein n=1 Tax=Daphnia magna TaxID=35525 RepID=A0ABQ9ZVQ2_9CRUS|nr:hypothetical protein OUZ56_031956 [Daphnia magna]
MEGAKDTFGVSSKLRWREIQQRKDGEMELNPRLTYLKKASKVERERERKNQVLEGNVFNASAGLAPRLSINKEIFWMVLFRVCDSRRSQETRETFQQHPKISFVFSESDSGGFWYNDSRQKINNAAVLIDCLVGRLHSLAVERHLVNVVCEIGMEEDKQMFSCEDVDSRKTRLNTSIRLMLCMSRPIV